MNLSLIVKSLTSFKREHASTNTSFKEVPRMGLLFMILEEEGRGDKRVVAT